MFVATNQFGKRVFAHKDLSRDTAYYCPICNSEVRLRAGDHNEPHFAHIHSCTDDFTYDMSEWHRTWQELFPLKNREVVIRYGNEVHRADVLCYGTVIEFQHSPISEDEFTRRNNFYTAAGYKVVWIFDTTDLTGGTIWGDSGRMQLIDEWHKPWGDGGKYRWKNPMRCLRNFLPQEEKQIDIFIAFGELGDEPKKLEADACMERVTWVNPNFEPAWGQFHTSYQCCNYAEFLNWLEARWKKTKR